MLVAFFASSQTMLDFFWLFVLSYHVPQLLFGSGRRVAAQLEQVTPPLVDFQVAQPPPLPKDAKQCTVQLLRYDEVHRHGAMQFLILCVIDVLLATPLESKSY